MDFLVEDSFTFLSSFVPPHPRMCILLIIVKMGSPPTVAQSLLLTGQWLGPECGLLASEPDPQVGHTLSFLTAGLLGSPTCLVTAHIRRGSEDLRFSNPFTSELLFPEHTF